MADLAVLTSSEPAAPAHAGYRLIVDASGKRIRALFANEVIADSDRALVMYESGYAPVAYFPRDDVRIDLLRRTEQRTHCPFKGDAAYWSVEAGGRRTDNAAWSYEDPYEEAEIVRDHIAFHWDQMDRWIEGDDEVKEQPRPAVTAKSNVLVDWLVRQAWRASTPEELIQRLAERLIEAELPLWRMRLMIRTLHPQLFATGFWWQSDLDGVQTVHPSHEVMTSPVFLESPFAPILRGEGGVRRRLEGPNPRLDYPILRDLHADGATDYVAMPMRFSDGQINIFTLVSREKGGFSTAQLGLVYEILPMLSRLFEVFSLQVNASTLLGTYLGRRTGGQVLNGQIKRGDGQDIDAAIWMCDLRNSTALSESLSRDAYLDTLNQFFDCMVEPIVAQGGEVLKYVGDSVLAIFPIEDSDSSAEEACARALAAAEQACAKVTELNQKRAERGEQLLGCGVGLHRGRLSYGNIGSSERLDFTVIGTAVNEVARIEDMTKTLRRPVLMSSAFAESYGKPLTSLGRHALRGVSGQQEIFCE